MLIHYTTDLSPAFFLKQTIVADELGAAPFDLLKVEQAESGVRADARNPSTNASGLIQFMPRILEGLGWTKGDEEFRRLQAVEQVPWVRRYFAPHAGKLRSTAALYVAVFLPALLDLAADENAVLCAKGARLGWVYAANAVFDANNDYVITVGELGQAVARNMVGPRWEEVHWRVTGKPLAARDVGFDLAVTLGQQRALARLGYSPGPLDGLPGARTAAAVKRFQADVGLKADGILGPLTKDALAQKLKAA